MYSVYFFIVSFIDDSNNNEQVQKMKLTKWHQSALTVLKVHIFTNKL